MYGFNRYRCDMIIAWMDKRKKIEIYENIRLW